MVWFTKRKKKKKKTITNNYQMEGSYKQLFIGGDLSGIQNFLYNISSKKAAVSLKGRSYYLQQYMKNVSAQIKEAVETAGARKTETIYCSGGKFYIVTDYSRRLRCKDISKVEKLQKNLVVSNFSCNFAAQNFLIRYI